MSNRSIILARIPSPVYLWVAVFIFAASNSVTRKVTEIGAQHLVNGRNPISLCNVLLIGNLCALAVMLLVFGSQWNRQALKQITCGDWINLAAIAILAGALAPGLIFAALDTTNVTNVVLVGRLEPPLTLAFSALLFKVQINRWTAVGSLVAFMGVAMTAFLASSSQPLPMMSGLQVGRGEFMAMIASFVLAIATVISKSRLSHISLGIFNITRVFLGTIIFFVLAKVLYGSQHFTEAFSPFLWKWMLLYGTVIVAAGQLCWLVGLRSSTPAATNLASSFNPLAAIGMAYLILGEVPTAAQYMGGAVIFVGIVLSLVGSLQEAKSGQPSRITYGQQMEIMPGFRGM